MESEVVDGALVRETVRRNLERVEARIQIACARAGRPREDITLVAITKTAPDAALPCLPELGLTQLGENRPQSLWRRAELLSRSVDWHLVGHLQRNKIERTVPITTLIHSVDSLRLLQALESAASDAGRPASVLIEVNTSREPGKQGFSPDQVPGLVSHLRALRHVRVRGLMTMAALEENPEKCRPCFNLLRSLRDQLTPELAGSHTLEHLSMGMSNDFEVAIEEGATLLRIGSALFEGIAEPVG